MIILAAQKIARAVRNFHLVGSEIVREAAVVRAKSAIEQGNNYAILVEAARDLSFLVEANEPYLSTELLIVAGLLAQRAEYLPVAITAVRSAACRGDRFFNNFLTHHNIPSGCNIGLLASERFIEYVDALAVGDTRAAKKAFQEAWRIAPDDSQFKGVLDKKRAEWEQRQDVHASTIRGRTRAKFDPL